MKRLVVFTSTSVITKQDTEIVAERESLRKLAEAEQTIATVCEQHGIAVTLFYNWQKQFFENGQLAFTGNDKRRKADTDAKDRQIADLQAKLQRKHEVLSELMEEHVQLKKELGEP